MGHKDECQATALAPTPLLSINHANWSVGEFKFIEQTGIHSDPVCYSLPGSIRLDGLRARVQVETAVTTDVPGPVFEFQR